MHKFTTLALLAAGLLTVGIGSASACSYSGIDVAVDGKGNVVELLDDGFGNQITGRVFGKYSKLSARIKGSCNVLVVEQRGRGTDVSVEIDGWNHHVGVLAKNGDVSVETDGHGSNILADVANGDVTISNKGANDIFVKTRS